MPMIQHPLSAAFPAMHDDEFRELVEDIRANGQLEPGIVLDDMVLDGWNRYRACEALGQRFWSIPFQGDDPAAFVLSKNIHRRHLSASQRADAIKGLLCQ